MVLVEAIACSADDARIAEAAGAGRLEVCSAMAVGGLTPSIGAFRTIRAATELPLMVMIRPRSSGFCYSQSEHTTILEDVASFVDEGADGIVVGVLEPSGQIDEQRLEVIVETADGKDVVFHRAFDAIPDSAEALEVLIRHRVRRVLTSGNASTAIQGLGTLARLVRQAANRIEILAGGGVRPDNVLEVVQATGVKQVHLGPFTQAPDKSLEHGQGTASIYGATYPLADGLAISRVVLSLRQG